MDREPLPDYSSTIRAEIVREISQLRWAMEREGGYIGDTQWPVGDVEAQYAKVGYLAASHHGRPILTEGEIIDGLPVRIDRSLPRSISVRADNVLFNEGNEDGEVYDVVRRDLVKQTTW